tara:strand:- start:856 stop:1254 length:399 start_codon:yes stop_codon:yes gene_type:complete
MINAWSLLGSVLDGTLDEEYPIKSMEDEELNPYEYYTQTGNVDLTVDSDVDCKYNEDQTLDLAKEYIKGTYSQHYANGNFQTLDLIESIGDAEAFCRSNAIKYLSRYDKKGRPQDDILKAVHYCVLLYYFSK